MDIEVLNNIAQLEFGMDYDQLGPNEKEWCEDEYVIFNLAEYENFLKKSY